MPGRALLKKYFTEAKPIVLPRGHSTIALSEPRIHSVLEVISDKAVATSIRAIRSLVSDTLKVGAELYGGATGMQDGPSQPPKPL